MRKTTLLLIVLSFTVNVFGQDWEELILPENNSDISDMIEHNGNCYIATSDGIYKSSNYGQNWIRIFNSQDTIIYHIAFVGETLIGGGNGIFRSYNYGETWQKVFTVDLEVNSISVSGNEVIISTSEHIYKNTNSGEGAWSHITSTPYNCNWVEGCTKISENTYVAEICMDLRITTDNMQTWEYLNINYKNNKPRESKEVQGYRFYVASNGFVFGYVNVDYLGHNERVLISTDNAESFSYISPAESNNFSEAISIAEYNGKMHVVRFDGDDNYDSELYASDDFGLTWYLIDELIGFNESINRPKMLKVYNGYAFMSTQTCKLYRKAFYPISINENEDFVFNIFPNPTTDVINLNFDKKNKPEVNISIIDITGKKVKDVLITPSEEKHNHKINVSDLKEGIYIINMQTNKNNISKKIIIK